MDMTFSATTSAASFDHCDIVLRTRSTEGAVTLNSVSPKDISRGIIIGSAAASPHIPTGMLLSLAAVIIALIILNTPGWNAEYRYATLLLLLSAAMVYPVRSLVPMLKKSDSFASRSAITPDAAVSVIMPVLILLSYGI